MKLYYIYILKCNDGLLYTGFTNDILRRFEEHLEGLNKSCFTYGRRPLEYFTKNLLMSIKPFLSKKKIKKWSSKKKLALANGDFDNLKLLAKCRKYSHSDNKLKEY